MATHPRPLARARLAAPLLAVVLAATACSSGEPDDETDAAAEASDATEPPAPEAVRYAALTDDLTMPLDAHHISEADQAVLEEARDDLIRACMAEYDQSYEPADRPPPAAGRYAYLYGVDSPEIAAEHGYLHPIDLDPHTYQPIFPDGLTTEQELALYGDPEAAADPPGTLEEARQLDGPELDGRPVPITGCHGEAVLTVNQPEPGWVDPTVVAEIENEAGHHADEDERVGTVLADWSACMADEGYETTSPLTVQEELDLLGDVSGPDAVAAAVADVGCKEETDLVGRWSAIDAEYQEAAIEEHAALLADLAEQHEERMARATRSS